MNLYRYMRPCPSGNMESGFATRFEELGNTSEATP
jgi:hypothetical protein